MDQARTELFKWLSTYEGIDKRWLTILTQTRTDHIVVLMYPDADFDDILLTMKWFYWGFLIDDTVDWGFVNAEGIPDLIKLYEDVLLNRDVSERGKLPLVIEVLRDVWNEIREKKQPGWENLFAEAAIHYVRALPEVNEFRKSAKTNKIDAESSFYEPVFHWTGLIHGYLIAPDLVCSPEMKELRASWVEVGWLRSGDCINLISLTMIHEKKTLQDAMDEAAQQIAAQLVRWGEAKSRVFETYREHKDINELKALIEANERGIWLPIGWSWVAWERYFASQKAAEEAQTTGIVHVMSRRNKTTAQ
ncbi:hypothetical protein MSAN_02120500 [Mycena sanguinolenta]|uniref:Terpene synthase n=1 Tax=Mycena sanguinolenta TaxID=230812 RepID=A0A8H6XH72_9AGAR|nr:hypothetical protein MSAN_02120500 [Mycena sanguinolenta]